LNKMGYRNFYGVDVSSSQIEYCRKHISERVSLANGIDFLEGRKDFYDVITGA